MDSASKAVKQLETMAGTSRSQVIQLCYHGAAGAVLVAQEKFTEAIPHLEEGTADPESMRLLWQAYTSTGATSEAQAIASKLAALNLPTVEQGLVVPQFRVSLVSQSGATVRRTHPRHATHPDLQLRTSQNRKRPFLALSGYTPSLSLEGLQLGVDNLRHDVHLSPKFVAQTRSQISRLIVRHGDVEGLLAAEAPQPRQGSHFIGSNASPKSNAKPVGLRIEAAAGGSAFRRAESRQGRRKPSLDVLARVAIIKFLRIELGLQFAQILERCRMTLKSYEGVRGAESAGISRARRGLPGGEKSHSAQDRAGTVSHPARNREGNSGTDPAIAVRK